MPAINLQSENEFKFEANDVVICDFWADWAKPCAQLNTLFDQLADTYPQLKFVKIEAEKLAELTEKHGVTVVPTFLFLKNGKTFDKIEGANGPELANKVSKLAGESKVDKEDLNTRLEKLINFAPVMLFMKGTPSQPQCGFSAKILDILKKENVEFSSFNILNDEEVRNGLKVYSNWPTYPQLYAKGKLVGGLDVVKELHEQSELSSQLPKSAIKPAAPAPAPAKPANSAEELNERLTKLVNTAPVMLFMKGIPEKPQCGFSSKIVKLLQDNKVEFSSFNILADEEVRQGLKVSFRGSTLTVKTFSNWPTYPQLYSKGKLVGGLDIVKELVDEGQLKDALK